jgi:hypothetical protein
LVAQGKFAYRVLAGQQPRRYRVRNRTQKEIRIRSLALDASGNIFPSRVLEVVPIFAHSADEMGANCGSRSNG